MSFDGLFEDINKNRLMLTAIVLAALLAIATIYYILPLADGIIFGIFFFFVTRPIKEYLGRYTKYSHYLATFCILLPFIVIIAYGFIEIRNEVIWIAGHTDDLTTLAGKFTSDLGLPFDVAGAVNGILANLAGYFITFLKSMPFASTFSSIILLAMNALISLFVCFYLLKDGSSFAKSLKALAPPRQQHVLDMFLTEADRLLSGIYTGTFYTALFIALGSLIVFIIFGIPYKALLTAFVFIAAMVPILSGMMVFLPITAYLYLFKSPSTSALFLAVVFIFVYLPPDFIIRPYLINKASDLHPLLIIFAFIGGGLGGGLSGFFAAPLVVGLLTAVYRTYKKTAGKGNEEIL